MRVQPNEGVSLNFEVKVPGAAVALTFLALKALPVLILGGFESIPGAIVGGLIVGASEKLAEVYIGPYVGGGVEGSLSLDEQLCFALYAASRAVTAAWP